MLRTLSKVDSYLSYTPRNMESHPSRIEPYNGNGELTVSRRMVEESLICFILECCKANIIGGT
jgi:hypothetical protein